MKLTLRFFFNHSNHEYVQLPFTLPLNILKHTPIQVFVLKLVLQACNSLYHALTA